MPLKGNNDGMMLVLVVDLNHLQMLNDQKGNAYKICPSLYVNLRNPLECVRKKMDVKEVGKILAKVFVNSVYCTFEVLQCLLHILTPSTHASHARSWREELVTGCLKRERLC